MLMRYISLAVSLLLTTTVSLADEPTGNRVASGQRAEAADSTSPIPTFRKVMSAPASFDDNFAHAVLAVSNEQQSLIARNYIVAGSSATIQWLREHPERQGARLFGLQPEKEKPTRVPDSTTFGFVPNSTLAWFLTCDSAVRFWDTRMHTKRDAVFPHTLKSECAGPRPPVSPDGKIMATQTSDTLLFWNLKTLKALSTVQDHTWVWYMDFSADGKWLFTRGRKQMKVFEPVSGKQVGGPFRNDLGNAAYSPKKQQLATFENNDEKEAVWKSAVVIRSSKGWAEVQRVEIIGRVRQADWIDDSHLLVVADEKDPRRKPPYTYGRKLAYVVSLANDKSPVQSLLRHTWIAHASAAPNGKHWITTTRDGTKCWSLGNKEPVWTKPEKYRVSFGDGDWVLLHYFKSVFVCSLTDGKVLWRKDNVIDARVDGSQVWLCGEKGVEVWRAELAAE